MALIKINEPTEKMLIAIEGVKTDAGIGTNSGAVSYMIDKWDFITAELQTKEQEVEQLRELITNLAQPIIQQKVNEGKINQAIQDYINSDLT